MSHLHLMIYGQPVYGEHMLSCQTYCGTFTLRDQTLFDGVLNTVKHTQWGNRVRIKVHPDLSPARVIDVIDFSRKFIHQKEVQHQFHATIRLRVRLKACCCITCFSDVSASAGVVDLDGADFKYYRWYFNQ